MIIERQSLIFFLNVYDEIIELYTFFEKLCILNTQNCIQSLKNVFIEYRKQCIFVEKLCTLFENLSTLNTQNYVHFLKNCVY